MSRTISLLATPTVIALSVGLGGALPAYASTTTKADPRNDVFLASLGGGIDLAGVDLTTLDRKKRIRITFRLHAPVSGTTLDGPGGMTTRFIKDERTWRAVRIATKNGVLRSEVCSWSTGSARPRRCSTLPVTQVDDTTYRTVVRLTQVRKGATVLQWTASSLDLTTGSPVSDQLTASNGEPFRWRL